MAGINDWYRDREFAADRDPTYDPRNDDSRDQLAIGELPADRVQRRWRVQGPQRGTRVKGKIGRQARPRNKAGGPSGGSLTVSGKSRESVRESPQQVPSKSPKPSKSKVAARTSGPPLKPTPAMARAVSQWFARNPRRSPAECAASMRDTFPRITGEVVSQILSIQEVQPKVSTLKPRSNGRAPRSMALPDRDSSYRNAIIQWRRLNPNGSYEICVAELRSQGYSGITRKLVSQTLLAQSANAHRQVSPTKTSISKPRQAKSVGQRKRGPAHAVEPVVSNQSIIQGCPACGIVPDHQSGSCACS